jgi:polycystin 1L2
LGELNFLRIWHDNSGKGGMASWYLKHIVIHDLQTREKYYFICEKWLAVDKDDNMTDRLLPVAGDEQKNELSYLLKKQTKNKLSDGHLWISVFARPVQSSFNRLDRLTCCFVLLYITMLANILYYDIDKTTNTDGLDIGPFKLTKTQVITTLKY